MFATSKHEGGAATESLRKITPAVDVYEQAEDLIFLADLPGVRSEDVKIEVDEGILTISAPLRAPARGSEAEVTAAEYHRSFELGPDLDAARISAAMRNGTLELLLPKAERAKPRKVEVKPAS